MIKFMDGRFGIQKSLIRYRDRLKRYGIIHFLLVQNHPHAWGGRRFFKGEIAF